MVRAKLDVYVYLIQGLVVFEKILSEQLPFKHTYMHTSVPRHASPSADRVLTSDKFSNLRHTGY